MLHEAEALAAALDDPSRLGRVSSFLAFHFFMMGAHDQAIAADGETDLRGLANRYLGSAYQARGDYRRAIDCFGQTVAALDEPQRRGRFGELFLPAVRVRTNLAVCHAELGTFAEGRALGEEGLRIARRWLIARA